MRLFILLLAVSPLTLFLTSCDAVDSDNGIDGPVSDSERLELFDDHEFVLSNDDYFEAWQLALWKDGELRADPETALMFLQHRDAIRDAYSDTLPETESIFLMPWEPGRLIIGADIEYMDEIQDGVFRYVDDLPAEQRPDSLMFLDHDEDSDYFYYLVYFDELLNVEVVADAYRQLPGVQFTVPDFFGTYGGTPFPVYPGYIDDEWYYLIYRVSFTVERTNLFRIDQPGLDGMEAELIISHDPEDEPMDEDTKEIIDQIHDYFRSRFFDRTSPERIEQVQDLMNR